MGERSRFVGPVIPADRLPPGFAERLEEPPDEPAPPVPAATAVLLRDAAEGPELLLLQRLRSSGFVPGAYVFPGGRVDEADAEEALHTRTGVLPEEPPPAYWFAAVREVFEETGVLLAEDPQGRPSPGSIEDAPLAAWRERLLSDAATLLDVLEAEQLSARLGDMVYFAHWITPLAEPRRYDTRFFLAGVAGGQEVRADAREMSDALWISPRAGLARFEQGRLPMVFPTIRTLESLAGFDSVEAILEAFRGRSVTPVLPRLVRTAGGVTIEVNDEG